MRRGPEYDRAYRARFETDAGEVVAEARHYPRQRVPRPHEAARQMARGGRLAMVEDPVHEWTFRIAGCQPATVRATPDGRFNTNAIRHPCNSLGELAKAWGARIARARTPLPEAEPDAPGP